jgi:hypothetical protein
MWLLRFDSLGSSLFIRQYSRATCNALRCYILHLCVLFTFSVRVPPLDALLVCTCSFVTKTARELRIVSMGRMVNDLCGLPHINTRLFLLAPLPPPQL